MDINLATKTILDYLKLHQRARNSVLIDLLGGNKDLFNEVREELILYDLAEDKKGMGLYIWTSIKVLLIIKLLQIPHKTNYLNPHL